MEGRTQLLREKITRGITGSGTDSSALFPLEEIQKDITTRGGSVGGVTLNADEINAFKAIVAALQTDAANPSVKTLPRVDTGVMETHISATNDSFSQFLDLKTATGPVTFYSIPGVSGWSVLSSSNIPSGQDFDTLFHDKKGKPQKALVWFRPTKAMKKAKPTLERVRNLPIWLLLNQGSEEYTGYRNDKMPHILVAPIRRHGNAKQNLVKTENNRLSAGFAFVVCAPSTGRGWGAVRTIILASKTGGHDAASAKDEEEEGEAAVGGGGDDEEVGNEE